MLRTQLETRMAAIESRSPNCTSFPSDASGPPASRRRLSLPPSSYAGSTHGEDDHNPLKVWVGGFTRPMLKTSLKTHGREFVASLPSRIRQ
eukprot:3706853-Pyramimonas_sp.AAC.1